MENFKKFLKRPNLGPWPKFEATTNSRPIGSGQASPDQVLEYTKEIGTFFQTGNGSLVDLFDGEKT